MSSRWHKPVIRLNAPKQAPTRVACEFMLPPPPPRNKPLENQLITGDSLYILKELDSASVGLTCQAPLFNSQRFYSIPVGAKETGTSFNRMTMQTPMRRNHHG